MNLPKQQMQRRFPTDAPRHREKQKTGFGYGAQSQIRSSVCLGGFVVKTLRIEYSRPSSTPFVPIQLDVQAWAEPPAALEAGVRDPRQVFGTRLDDPFGHEQHVCGGPAG